MSLSPTIAARSNRSHAFWLFTFLAIALAVVYSGAFAISYLEDDYQWVFANPSRTIFGGFFHTIASDNQWFRPMQSMLLGVIQSVWGLQTWPIRIAEILLHSALAAAVYKMLRELDLPKKGAISGAIFCAFSQIAALVVISNDMLAQTLSGFFCTLCLWQVWSARSRNIRIPLIAVLWFVLALLSKETSAGLIVGVGAILMIYARRTTIEAWIRDMLAKGLPFGALWILYMIYRSLIGATKPSFGSGTYGFNVGLNIPKNLGLFITQSLMPVSSLEIMKAWYFHNLATLAIATALGLIMTCLLAYGLIRSTRRKTIFVLCLLWLTSLMPAVFLNHVSESYLYNTLPWLGMLVGIAVEYWLKNETTTVRTLLVACGVLLLAANIHGSVTKAAAMKSDADRADTLMGKLLPVVKALPPHERLYLVNPMGNVFEYSVYTEKGFRVLNCTELFIARVTGRSDVSILIADTSMFRDSSRVKPGIALTYDFPDLHLTRFRDIANPDSP